MKSSKVLIVSIAAIGLLIAGIYVVPALFDSDVDHDHFSLTPTAKAAQLDPRCNGKDEPFLPYGHLAVVYCDDTFMYVDALTSLADHDMMIGITGWNQQVPIPHSLIGENAYTIPIVPQESPTTTPSNPRGYNGVMINGVGFFNPNALPEGDYSPEFDVVLRGELDICGGHAGQADDYHYHYAPLCIMEELEEAGMGDGIIAYALDGAPVYGFTNADGSEPELDECGGEFDENGVYHYHVQREYPYILECFHYSVDFSEQPRTTPIRPATQPLAVDITSFTRDDNGTFTLEYVEQNQTVTRAIRYTQQSEDCFFFEFISNVETGAIESTETYCRDTNQPPPPPGN